MASIQYQNSQNPEYSEYQALVDYLHNTKVPNRKSSQYQSMQMPDLEKATLQNTIAQFMKNEGNRTKKNQTVNEYKDSNLQSSRPPSVNSKRPKSIFSSTRKKKRERFNEELSQAVDDARSTMRSRQGMSKRNRDSIKYSMNKNPQRDLDLLSITITDASGGENKSRASRNPNQDIERKADLINQIKNMDDVQLKNSYHQIKSIISESSKVVTENQSQITKADFKSIQSSDFDQDSLRPPPSQHSTMRSGATTMFQSQIYIKELEGKLERERQEKERMEREMESMRESQRSMQEMLNKLLFDAEFKDKSGKRGKQK